jgi:ABC-type multidrug transport system fused ATPase/permease subunit
MTQAPLMVSKETKASGKLGMAFYKQYFKSMDGFKKIGPFLFLLILVENTQSGVFRWLLGRWVDQKLPNATHTSQTWLVGMWEKLSFTNDSSILSFILLVVSGFILWRAFTWTLVTSFLARGGRILHEKMINALSKVRVTFFDENPTGRVTTRLGSDYDQLKRDLPNYINDILGCLAELIWVVLFVLLDIPWVVAITLPCLWMYVRVHHRYTSVSREIQRTSRLIESPLWSLFTEATVGWQSIRTYGKSHIFQTRFNDFYDNYLKMSLLRSRLTRWLNVRLKLISEFFSLFLTIGVCLAFLDHKISIGTAGFLLSAGMGLDSVMQWLTRTLSMIEASMVSLERVQEYTNLPSEELVSKTPYPSPSLLTPAICFDSLTASYRQGLSPILNQVSFEVPFGLKLGVIGKTGAGKSSLFQALFRMLHIHTGTIKVAGIDFLDLPLWQLRGLFGIVPQEPHLFSGTLRSNLDRTQQRHENKIWEALEAVQMKRFVESLPGKLDATIAEKGLNFSSGQRQLFCMARAILLATPIVLLDEATSSLDSTTDSLIQDVVANSFRNNTVITIAHRLSTLTQSHKILVMNNGTVIDFDSPEQVLERFQLNSSAPDLAEWGIS